MGEDLKYKLFCTSRKLQKGLLLFIFLQLFYTSNVWAQQYFTVAEMLSCFYPTADSIDYETKTLTQTQIQNIKAKIKIENLKNQWTIYKAISKNKIAGYIIMDNVMGKEQPISYAVSISPTGIVNEVEVMVYRESHGGQIKNQRFRNQFKGKSTSDPLTAGRDIINISGATISVRNITQGVQKVLWVWETLYH